MCSLKQPAVALEYTLEIAAAAAAVIRCNVEQSAGYIILWVTAACAVLIMVIAGISALKF